VHKGEIFIGCSHWCHDCPVE